MATGIQKKLLNASHGLNIDSSFRDFPRLPFPACVPVPDADGEERVQDSWPTIAAFSLGYVRSPESIDVDRGRSSDRTRLPPIPNSSITATTATAPAKDGEGTARRRVYKILCGMTRSCTQQKAEVRKGGS
ncbi:unnamed protein product [Zymoseptoria tritici ST99CH_3D1]|uniref:Uncharacterized protein n=1 Tax=Zymoseptoria tritici (strain CBS 115943 / IPO323) TaxID=336722 RepID=F9XRA5_ZYMTI|nr:uncharacterized protein MYCGRDRAFT_97761 [Zymoseptoria tritici IPO323]EGP82222.1 hypothetical protein MYCGRDRAFT_97761 [Zymoseptoria tritici IPO323]SMR64885.1 unnamed protein product [Zymoseptoria tritici ST99CH_3D1]